MEIRKLGNLILIKLASRCNINCDYCYWFKDASVFDQPAMISDVILDTFVAKLEKHIIKYSLKEFRCVFHGGEPLLYDKKKFIRCINQISMLKASTGCNIQCSLTTNGILVDDEWCTIFVSNNISVAVSIDGPEEIHNKHRVDFKREGTFVKVIEGYKKLVQYGVDVSILGVCDPSSNPIEILKFFVEDLSAMKFNILFPDLTRDDVDNYLPVAPYYTKMFDFWYENLIEKGIEVKFLEGFLRVMFGLESNADSFGYGPCNVITLQTNGGLEPNDVVKVQGNNSTQTSINIITHELDQISEDSLWNKIYQNSINLCEECNSCEYKLACGGGHITTRWSKNNGYDNTSIYCSDMKEIFSHVRRRISIDLNLN